MHFALPARGAADVRELQALLRTRRRSDRRCCRKHAPIARQMVRKLINSRIVFTPDRASRRYTFLAPGTLTNFFSGMVCPQAVASKGNDILLHRSSGRRSERRNLASPTGSTAVGPAVGGWLRAAASTLGRPLHRPA